MIVSRNGKSFFSPPILNFSVIASIHRDMLIILHSCSISSRHFGKGSTSTFRTLDLETATEGEYWIIFRGFLLLHRDAVSGRFAAQRASGFSSHYNRKEDEERRHAQNRKKDWKVSEENEYVHHWQRLWRKWKGEPEIEKPVLAPPSDYFLGFRSAGTQVSFVA